jgi:arginine N-succinyltransferase
VASAGYAAPFYVFRNDALIHASRELHVSRKIHALTMSHELTGKSRFAGFYLDPAVKGDEAAHLLSRARMMYIAANRRRFTPEVFSLLLGVSDEGGTSPFWEAVGRRFFRRDFPDVEKISGGRSATFIAEVMPSYPLYVPLLPENAQRVLGEPNAKSLLAYDIHLEEGFEPDRFVDIFDAGPVLTAHVDRTACVARNEMRIVHEVSQRASASACEPTSPDGAMVRDAGRSLYLVASGRADRFGCVVAELPRGTWQGAPLTSAARAALGVVHGDPVRCVPLSRYADETSDTWASTGTGAEASAPGRDSRDAALRRRGDSR